jgi:hypothetical protein
MESNGIHERNGMELKANPLGLDECEVRAGFTHEVLEASSIAFRIYGGQ